MITCMFSLHINRAGGGGGEYRVVSQLLITTVLFILNLKEKNKALKPPFS